MLFACLPGQADNEVVRDRRRIIFVLAATLAFPRGAFPQGPEKTYTPPPPEARVDINHATVADLLKVPGNDADLGRTHRALQALSHQDRPD